jgi:antitoxin component YwqK of YwqJK toxin-antitoxin module
MIQFLLLFTLLSQSADKFYNKTYHLNGNIASEGWIQDNKKIDYWFYYFDNGSKKCQGSYKDNKKKDWWIVYNTDGSILKKCEYKNDILNGLSILYNHDKIICAEKYENGIKKKIYYSIEEYKKDQK